MHFSGKCLVSIALLASTASACAESDADLQQKIERTLDRPDAASAVSPASVASDLTTVGQFRGTVNGTTGELTIDMLGPDQVTDAGLRMAAQGLCALDIIQDGIAGSGPANSLELVTDNTGLDEACPAAAGAPAFCGDVTIRSFYTRPLSNLFAQIDTLVPSSGFSVANGDQVVGASSGLGSWAYPDLEASGGASSATRNWLFTRSGGNFTFTGRVVANVPELCNGLDDDCDGIVDEGAQCRGLGASCTATADCGADLTCNAGLCRTQCGDGNLEAMEQCDEGNAITETCAYGEASCTVCDSLCQLVPGAISSCGDGTLNAPFEECDDSNLATEACAYGAASCTVCDPACKQVAGAPSLCGDGTTDPAHEQCDDGNTVTDNCPYGDTICSVCDSNCQSASGIPQVCGDSIVNGAESCDDGNQTTEACAYGETACAICNASCASAAGATAFCGDGLLAANETCDDGNLVDGDSCSSLCTCGTGYHLEGGSCQADIRACSVANGTGIESWGGSAYGACQATLCDTTFHVAGLLCESDVRGCTVTGGSGTQAWNGTAFGACSANACDNGYSLLSGACVAVGCGNSVVEAGEACDDGNQINTDSCTTVCTVAACGDGFVQAAEGCDEGNTVTEACAYGETSCTICDATCASVAGATSFCGDGILAGAETCDDGNSVDADSCGNSCLCGAGFHLEAGSCVADIRSCIVANGAGSESWTGSSYGACQATSCDATFHIAGLLCESDVQACTVTGGSGTQQWNGTAFAACVATSCSNGYSLLNGSCVAVGCGNSVVEAGEGCDDGNTDNTDACTSSCTIAACGDGFVQSGESCDEGNTVTEACAYGQTSCTVCDATCASVAGATAFCGDSAVNGTETCDDGNQNGADGCANDCGCSVGYHLEGGLCTIDTRSCVIANGTGSQSWTGSAYGACQVTSCNNGFHAAGNLCENDIQACTVTGGSGTQQWNGTAFAACVATSCTAGYSLLSGSCVEVGCGNSVVEAGEACDDGNSINTDGCTSACALPACGDGYQQAGEGCDEGNTVTEACAYGQTSCTVCTATCQLAAGAATFCGDGVVQNGEVCDDGNSSDADSCSNSCACGTGYHLEAGVCTIDTRSCTTANGTGSQSWTGAAYGACTATSCSAGYTIVAGACVNSRSCTVANGAGTQSWSGSAWNACVASTCDASFHIEAGICAADSRVCSAGNGSGTQSWSGSAWGSCQLTACNSTYHLVAGVCVSDTQSCTIANGTGTQSWTGSGWGSCTASSCNASYHVEAGACATDTRACTVTGGTGTQTWTGSAYSTCAATSCTPGYHLETATCVADTRACTVTNGTGTQDWNASTATEVSAGEFHTCALKQDNTISCWGYNVQGQTTVPAGASNFTDVSAGGSVSCGLRSNGTVACWGSGSVTTPTSGLNTATQVAAGDAHACALRANGTVTCWGSNSSNQTSVSGSLTGVTQIDLGDFFSCALKSDGTVSCWGSNSDGQRTPTSGLNTATQISAGGTHACARKSDGTVTCWGSNGNGQRTVSGGLTGVTQVAAGGTHTCALKSDGTVVCWGNNGDGQRTVPAGLSGVTQISAGDIHTCALKSDKSVVCWGDNTDGQSTPPIGVAPAVWTSCTMTACNTGFHDESGLCVSDTRSCTVTGGTGTQTWSGSAYSTCFATACTTGYTLVSGACSRAGNVLVERIGNGSSTLTADASLVSLVEYSATSGSLLFTSPAFSSGTYRLNDAGTTTSAGYFNIANGVIAVGGYDDSLGNSNILTNNNKVVNFFNSELSPTTQISFPGSGVLEDDNIRSVWPGPSGTFYAVGNGISGTSGVWYYNGSSFVRISSTSSSLRSVESFGGNLYYSTTSGTAGIYQVGTGLPSTTGITATRIITATSPTGFLLLDCDGNGTLERAYVADDGTTSTSGLRRFDLSGGTWNASYSKLFGASGNTNLATSLSGGMGIRGISGSCTAGTATLYATTTETANNRLVKVVDSSANGSTGTPSSYTQLSAAGSNYVFRGVELRPF